MSTDNYCSASPPHYSSSDTPHTKPPSAVHLYQMHCRSEKQPVLVSVVTSTGKWW